jgi:hypothetical protein
MSYVIAAPEMMTAAATDVANIGSALSAAKAAAAAPTTGIVVAAEDEVSAAIAAVFSAHGRGFQALGARAAAFHEQFVQLLTADHGHRRLRLATRHDRIRRHQRRFDARLQQHSRRQPRRHATESVHRPPRIRETKTTTGAYVLAMMDPNAIGQLDNLWGCSGDHQLVRSDRNRRRPRHQFGCEILCATSTYDGRK